MNIFFSMHFKLDSGSRFCHNTADERNHCAAGATSGIGRYPSHSRSDLRASELESAPIVGSVVRRVGVAKRKRPNERHGCPEPARETSRSRSDRVAASPTDAVESHGLSENIPASL